ncbi:MAG: DNA replication/repair protein RecF [Lachnospiraceae bacterium]|nr:DNA replication/repair protein RecF [Lachnospiraceae bacterium]
MIVRSLELNQYRNYESVKVEFDPGTNVIFGDNAQGKTNLLEAIYECAVARSHRGSKDRDVIRFGEEEGHIRLVAEKGERPVRIDLHLKKNKPKGAAVDGVPIRRVSELFGVLHVVFFSPEDLKIVKSSPQERRRFIDEELCQLDRIYTSDLISYNKALLQRNDLLKFPKEDKEFSALLDVWDEQLVRCGRAVMKAREEFIKELDVLAAAVHRELTGGREELSLAYTPSVSPESFEEKLFLGRDIDIRLGSSQLGPHRDDMECMINGVDVRRFGSQGQQRTAALSLKMAEIELVKQKIHDAPVLLLDDVLSELDSDRQERLLGSLSGVQTFLSCTGLDDFIARAADVGRKYRVEANKVEEITNE